MPHARRVMAVAQPLECALPCTSVLVKRLAARAEAVIKPKFSNQGITPVHSCALQARMLPPARQCPFPARTGLPGRQMSAAFQARTCFKRGSRRAYLTLTHRISTCLQHCKPGFAVSMAAPQLVTPACWRRP